MLWDKLDPFFDFQDSSAIAGALFEIPGGSPYVAYLDMVGRMDFGGDYVYIKESGYQLIPEPGTAWLLGAGLLGLIAARKRFEQ